MKLVLFDIDGTLISSDGAGRRAVREALLQEMGTTGPIDGFRFDGKTDRQIIRDLMRAAEHPHADSQAHIDAVCDRYVALLRTELDRDTLRIRVYPGVEDLLDAIEERADAVLGLLTGNLVRGAELKLRRAGIAFERFRVGAFGSDAAERPDLPPIAADRAAPIMGGPPNGDEIVIIGDTPADVTCGAGVRARAIAVATGFYEAAELAAAGAYAVFDDFTATEQVIDAIFA